MFNIKIVNHVFSVRSNYTLIKQICNDYLINDSANVKITVNHEDIEYERIKAMRENEIEGIPYRKISDAYLETTIVQRKITEKLFEYDVLLFHGSVIAIDGNAYLFTAKSGTGKSTHTRLWREVFGDRAVMVNDDKPFLEIRENQVIAHGSPWNGKHRLGENISLPLRAICILERGETNEIHPITPAQALPMLMQQSQRPQDRKKLPLYMDLIDQLSSRVRFYRMRCNMDPQAARMSYDAMRPKETIEMENHNED